MRYRLRTLLIVLAVGPIFLAGAYWGWRQYSRRVTDAEWEEALKQAKVVSIRTGPIVVPGDFSGTAIEGPP